MLISKVSRLVRTPTRRGKFKKMYLVSALSATALFGSLVSVGDSYANPAHKSDSPTISQVASSNPQGAWLSLGSGSVTGLGESTFGSTPILSPGNSIVGMGMTSDDKGYWLAASNGPVFDEGDAQNFGSMQFKALDGPIVGFAVTSDGQGYWEVGQDGGVFAFGDAPFRGSLVGTRFAGSVVGICPTPTGNGYWLVTSDGGVYNFGDATYHGSLLGRALNAPIVAIAGDNTGNGYWLLGQDGGVFAFGDAGFFGTPATGSYSSIVPTVDSKGYWIASQDGFISAFGDASQIPEPQQATAYPVTGLAISNPFASGNVLLVGTYKGIPGEYSTIQDAVNAAKPGDWILVAPGDYKEDDDLVNPPSPSDISSGWYGGVDISTPDIHIRGMNRNTVIVDGTKPGAPACSSNPADQQLGVDGSNGPIGRNGILIWEANNVSIENLTVCNFLGAGNVVLV